MKRTVIALAALVCAGLTILPNAAQSQLPGKSGKGYPFGPDGGATFKAPWLEASNPTQPANPSPIGATPSYIKDLLPSSGGTPLSGNDPRLAGSLSPYQTVNINNDILVPKEAGPWMILVMSYSGAEGPARARKMVKELRETYKLPAYVFNYGAEEKRAELERVKKLIEERKKGLEKEGVTVDFPIRVKHAHIDEHVGVLVGGYSSSEAAAKARKQMEGLKPPDPSRVDLDISFYTEEEGKPKREGVYVNPFAHALVVHNPTSKVERPSDVGKLDVAVLKRLNSEEEYNLLKCKKPWTLVIKQFNVPSVTTPRSEAGLLETMGLKKTAQTDYAAENAHELARGLRQAKMEAYVLHTKFYSLVTIGGFDGREDPNLRAMQNLIETRLVPAMQGIELFPKALPWEIPH
jgi:hypothetical protein